MTSSAPRDLSWGSAWHSEAIRLYIDKNCRNSNGKLVFKSRESTLERFLNPIKDATPTTFRQATLAGFVEIAARAANPCKDWVEATTFYERIDAALDSLRSCGVHIPSSDPPVLHWSQLRVMHLRWFIEAEKVIKTYLLTHLSEGISIEEIHRAITEPKAESTSSATPFKCPPPFATVDEVLEKWARNESFPDEQVFKEDLVFLSRHETTVADSIRQLRHSTSRRIALVEGQVGSGKTVLALRIGREMYSRKAYYLTFKENPDLTLVEQAWSVLLPQRDTLIVIDDCHLRMEEAVRLYRSVRDARDPEAVVLFISRPHKVEHPFDEADTTLSHIESRHELSIADDASVKEKMEGIIANYKKRKSDGGPAYVVGDINSIIQHTHRNFKLLYLLLKLWEEQRPLDAIVTDALYGRMFDQYLRLLIAKNDDSLLDLLVSCAALYHFEVPFFPIKSEHASVQALIARGWLEGDRNNGYIMHHAQTAALVLHAYATRVPRLHGRQWKFDELILSRLSSYILKFDELPRMDHFFQTIHRHQGTALLRKLMESDEVFVKLVHHLESITADMEELAGSFRLFLQSSKELPERQKVLWSGTYVKALMEGFSAGGLNGYSWYLPIVATNYTVRSSDGFKLWTAIAPRTLAQLMINCTFGQFGWLLGSLNANRSVCVDVEKLMDLLDSQIAVLKTKAQEAPLGGLGVGLLSLNSIKGVPRSKDLVATIIGHLNQQEHMTALGQVAARTSFSVMGRNLLEISRVYSSGPLMMAISEHLRSDDLEAVCQTAARANFSGLGDGLASLNNMKESLGVRELVTFILEYLSQKEKLSTVCKNAEVADFSGLGKNLLQLHRVPGSDTLVNAVIDHLKCDGLEAVFESALRAGFSGLGDGLASLNGIPGSGGLVIAILEHLSKPEHFRALCDKAVESGFSGLGKNMVELSRVDGAEALVIDIVNALLEQDNLERLVERASKTSFAARNHGIMHLGIVSTPMAVELISGLDADKVRSEVIDLLDKGGYKSVVSSLSRVVKLNPDFFTKILRDIDLGGFVANGLRDSPAPPDGPATRMLVADFFNIVQHLGMHDMEKQLVPFAAQRKKDWLSVYQTAVFAYSHNLRFFIRNGLVRQNDLTLPRWTSGFATLVKNATDRRFIPALVKVVGTYNTNAASHFIEETLLPFHSSGGLHQDEHKGNAILAYSLITYAQCLMTVDSESYAIAAHISMAQQLRLDDKERELILLRIKRFGESESDTDLLPLSEE